MSSFAFQDFVADVYVAVHGDDFSRIRARGRAGDGGCDGFVRSSGTVLQCYGADATADRRGKYVADKIRTDFETALRNFDKRMIEWRFVHNMFEGLPYEAEIALIDLRAAYPSVKVTVTTREGIEKLILALEDESVIEDLLGPSPSDSSYSGIDVSELLRLLKGLAAADIFVEPDAPIHRVPRKKIEYNRLSSKATAILDRQFELDVVTFIETGGDPTLGDRVAKTLERKYVNLRDQGMAPDDILMTLVYFVLGENRIAIPSVGEEIAARAIIAYFFYRCDVFEDVPVI